MPKGCGENPSRVDVVSALNCKKLISVVFVSPKVIQKSDYCKNDSVPKGILNGIARFQNHQNFKKIFTAIQFLLLEIDFPLSREK
jgi:hypothetical protein